MYILGWKRNQDDGRIDINIMLLLFLDLFIHFHLLDDFFLLHVFLVFFDFLFLDLLLLRLLCCNVLTLLKGTLLLSLDQSLEVEEVILCVVERGLRCCYAKDKGCQCLRDTHIVNEC